MPRRYNYVVTCIKETPVGWGIELESLGDPIPPKIIRLPYLTQPLTKSPYFQSGYDPMTYFKQLLKGMANMLRDYNTRILKRIQGRLDQLGIGECCYVKVSYIDSGGEVSPYNYDIQPIEDLPLESQYANRQESPLFSAALSADSLRVPPGGEIDLNWQDSDQASTGGRAEPLGDNALDIMTRIAHLQQEIKQLQTDVDLINRKLSEGHFPSQKGRGEETTKTAEEVVAVKPTVAHNGSKHSHKPHVETKSQQKKNRVMLDRDETTAVQSLMNQKVITESQLTNECNIGNPTEVMASLIDKMEQYDSPWIDVQKSENGELMYLWNRPAEEGT